MRRYRKPLPADYTDRRKTGRPTGYWHEAGLPGREPTLLELLEALEKPGCPICFLAGRTVERYLRGYCHESVTDVQARDRIRAAGGFCTRHAHQFLGQRDSLAVAITYADVLKSLTGKLDGVRTRPRSGWLARLIFRAVGSRPQPDPFTPSAPCPACVEQIISERRYGTALVEYLLDPEVLRRFRAGKGLCAVHLRPVLTMAQGEAAAAIVEVQRDAWRELRGRLEEIVRKADYRFMEEGISAEEKDSLQDSINRAAGERELR